jgi:hypothetical protein
MERRGRPGSDQLIAAPPPARFAAELLRALSRRRGRRVFHPFGVGFAAELLPLDAGDHVPRFEGEALVRLSRSLGLPEWLPDPCGLGIRVPDAHGPGRHQDLLLVSSGASPVARHLPLPSRGFCDRPYSSILPYRLAGQTVVVLASPVSPPGPGPRLAELRDRVRADVEFELALAGPSDGPRPMARLRLGRRLPAAVTERLDLDPGNSGGLEPVGVVNRMRGPSYRASQAGRESTYVRRGLPGERQDDGH